MKEFPKFKAVPIEFERLRTKIKQIRAWFATDDCKKLPVGSFNSDSFWKEVVRRTPQSSIVHPVNDKGPKYSIPSNDAGKILVSDIDNSAESSVESDVDTDMRIDSEKETSVETKQSISEFFRRNFYPRLSIVRH